MLKKSVENSGGQSRENQGGKNKRKKRKKRKRERNKKKRSKKKKKERKKKRKPKRERIIEVKKVAKEQEIWNEEEKAAKSEEETKKLVLQRFYKWIYVFGKKVSEKILMKKMQDHAIELKKEFMLRKEKMYLLSREEREEVCKFIKE